MMTINERINYALQFLKNFGISREIEDVTDLYGYKPTTIEFITDDDSSFDETYVMSYNEDLLKIVLYHPLTGEFEYSIRGSDDPQYETLIKKCVNDFFEKAADELMDNLQKRF